MSAIRTAKHRTKKRIVVNLKTNQTVNVAKIWAVSHKYKGNYWSRHYYKKNAEQALKDQLGWGKDLFIERIDYGHILDDEGCPYNNWIEPSDPAQPHKAARELNTLLAQL